jgi:hypothetical protein
MALASFAFHPLALGGGLALFSLGFLAFAQAVWNTSRVPYLGELLGDYDHNTH